MLDGITDSMNINLDREAWRATVHRVAELDKTEQLNNKGGSVVKNPLAMQETRA